MKKLKDLAIAFFKKYKDLMKGKILDVLIKSAEDLLKYLKK